VLSPAALGFDTVDAGTLKDSSRFASPNPAFVDPYAVNPATLTGADTYSSGKTASSAAVQAALDLA
jgi:hypothetical protein